MESLPDCILLKIFQYVSQEELCLGMRMTCTRWWRLSQDPELWKHVDIPDHFSDRRLLSLLTQINLEVEDLECSKCENLTEDGFKAIAELQFPRLKKLAIPLISTFSDDLFRKLLPSCPNLAELANVKSNFEQVCDPLLAQALVPGLTILHDKPVTSYGRIRKIVPKLDDQKRRKWETGVTNVSACCPHVTIYSCNRGLEYLNDAGFERICTSLPNLKELELRQCSLTDQGFEKFFHHNKAGLTDLIMDKPGNITDHALQIIGDNCPDLVNIKVSRCDKVTNKGVAYLAQKCPRLNEIHLNNNEGYYEEPNEGRIEFDDECVTCIATNCPDLLYFRLFYTQRVALEGISGLVDGCRFLRGIMLFHCPNIDDSCMSALVNLPFLKAVVMVNCDGVSPKGVLQLVLAAPSLNRLTLYVNNDLFRGDFSQLAEDIYNEIDDNTKNYRPSVITKITVRNVGGGFLQLLTVLCPLLRQLDIREGKAISMHSLNTVVRNAESIRSIDVSSVINLDDTFLHCVSEYMKELCILYLGRAVSNCSNDAIADVIKTCPSLRTISMDTYTSRVDENLLCTVAKDYHGGRCFMHIDPEYLASPARVKSKYVELHFTPMKYLGSINPDC